MTTNREPVHTDKVSDAARSFPICKDHQSAEWNQPTLDDGSCILCHLFYLEAQESLLEEWQQRAERAESTIAEVERPLSAQMARLNATVARLNDENERLQRLADTRSAGEGRDAVIEECVRAASRRFAKATAHHTVSAIVEAIRALKDEPVGIVERLETALASQIDIANAERAAKEKLEAVARSAKEERDTKRLDYIARSLHIDATDDQPVWGLFIPGSEPFISQPWDIRRLIDEAMALDEAKDASPDRKGPANGKA